MNWALQEIVLVVVLAFFGGIVHEYLHWIVGKLFGADPYFSSYWFFIPDQTDYRNMDALSNAKIRVTAGIVYVFPVLAIVGAWFHVTPLLYFGLGGAAPISASDLTAAQYPDAWRKISEREPISFEEFEPPTTRRLWSWLRS